MVFRPAVHRGWRNLVGLVERINESFFSFEENRERIRRGPPRVILVDAGSSGTLHTQHRLIPVVCASPCKQRVERSRIFSVRLEGL